MGLDTTHDCWHGAYSAFGRWRDMLAQVAGIPPLDLMEAYYPGIVDVLSYVPEPFDTTIDRWQESLPIKWESLYPDVLHVLLNHSDCDGCIPIRFCDSLANRLEELLPLLPEGSGGGHIGDWKEKTQRFINGLRLADSLGENVEFG